MSLYIVMINYLFTKTKKMKLVNLLFIAIGLIVLSACDTILPCGSSKEDFLEKYETFISQVGEQNLSANSDEWEQHDREFKQMVESCHEMYELTMTEEVEFWGNAMIYYSNRYGSEMLTVLNDESNGVSVEISENLEEFFDDPEAMMNKIFGEEKSKNLKKLFKEATKDVEKWSKKLEKIFED
jgi:hypothetical protein